ncbi:MAG: metallophosphoesterase family protein [Deltaproteobacteria bacterium]
MRYGIFSDIHSNREALDTVLSAFDSEDIDMFFCVGDIVGYGAQPVDCIARVRNIPAIFIAGNHDQAVAGLFPIELFNPDAREAVDWTRDRLSREDIAFLSGLRLVYRDEPLTLVHGTLDEPAEFHYLTDISAAKATFALLETEVCFVGHTHVAEVYEQDGTDISLRLPGTVELGGGRRYIVNVGSVGQPRDGDPRASYCVFDTEKRTIEMRRVEYDARSAARKIIDAGLPPFLGDRLLYGR